MALPQFTVTKTLTSYDTTAKVVLPIHIRNLIPIPEGQNFLDLQVIDSIGKNWELRFYTRPDGSRTNPVFSAGWLRFVRAKGIQPGDELIFSGRQVGAVGEEMMMQYEIKVIRYMGFSFDGQRVYENVENLPSV